MKPVKSSNIAAEIRIHAYLAQLGYGSRRSIEALIEKGKVQINGKPAKLGQKVQAGQDEIQIKGQKVAQKTQEPIVFLVNKPVGVVTTTKDPQRRTTIMDLIPRKYRRALFPVGRLDINSEGLMILTNDGELAQHIMHPKYEVPKVYDVKIRGELNKRKTEAIKKGPRIEAKKFKPAEILDIREVTRTGFPKYQVRLRIFEGKNHHIRKMFNHLKCHVLKLKRLSIGSVSVKGIAIGEYKILQGSAVEKIRKEFSLEAIPERVRKSA